MLRSKVLWLFVAIILVLVYVFWAHPEFYWRFVQYPGAGSPFVNTPSDD